MTFYYFFILLFFFFFFFASKCAIKNIYEKDCKQREREKKLKKNKPIK